MIKRKYFFSVKVAHNNNAGDYSYWHDFVTHKSLFPNQEMVMKQIRSDCKSVLNDEVPRRFCGDDVEFLAFNRT
jgi:hypothetical protein